MGDLKVGELWQDRVFIKSNAFGVGATGLTPTCYVLDESGNRSSISVVEISSGWYYTSFTPDAAGTWCVEWRIIGDYTIYFPWKEFKVGGGRTEDNYDLLTNATYGLSTLDTEIDTITTRIGDPSAHTLVSLTAKFGNSSQSLLTVLGLTSDSEVEGGSVLTRLAWIINGIRKGSGTVLPANKSLYDVIALDRLDSATYGLSALNTDLDNIILQIGNFQARTNQKTILATFGLPDVVGKDLYTLLITDRLDSATFGLSVLAKEATLTHATYGLDKIKTETAAIKAKTDLIVSGGATEVNVDAVETKVDAVKTVVDLIKTETDTHPTLGEIEATTVLAKVTTVTTAHGTTDGKVDALENKIKASPSVDSLLFKSGGAVCPTGKSIWDVLGDTTISMATLSAAIAALENKIKTTPSVTSIFANGTGFAVAPTNKSIWDALGDGSISIVTLNTLLTSATYGLSALNTDIDSVITSLANGTYGLSALQALLASGTYGLAAIKAYVDSLETWLGDPSGHTLTSITAKFGNNSQSLATILENFTSTEAGYLGQRIAWLQTFIGKGSGTALATNKSLIDTLLLDVNLDHLIQTASTCKASCTVNLLQTNLTEVTDDHYNGLCLIITSGSLAGQSSIITDYNGTTKEITLDPALIETPANTDGFIILGVGVGKLRNGSKGLEQIYDLIDSIFKLKRIADTTTTDGNEQIIWIYDAPATKIKARQFIIDTTAHTATETLQIRVYVRMKSGGNYIKVSQIPDLVGVQDPLAVAIPLIDNLYGIKITIQKSAGTNRAYDWEVYMEEP